MIAARHPAIAIDTIGGSFGPEVTIPAALMAIKNHDNLTVILVGESACIEAYLDRSLAQPEPRCLIQPLGQNDQPFNTPLPNAEASIQTALNLVKQKKVDACISAGDTQTLITRASTTLNLLPGIDHAALSLVTPTLQPPKTVRLLDVGAHFSTQTEDLLQHAKMGITLSQAVDQIPSPTFGLLDTGQAFFSHSAILRKAHEQFSGQTTPFNYAGYIPFDALFNGGVDVILFDGATGHIIAHTVESLLKSTHTYLKQSRLQGSLSRLASSMLKPFFNQIEKQVNVNYYNGASLVGYDGTLIKSHEKANQEAFYYAIQKAIIEVEQTISERIQSMNRLFE